MMTAATPPPKTAPILPAPSSDGDTTGRERNLYAQIEQTMRRVKRALYHNGSKSTEDFVHSLVAKWLDSAEFQRLRDLPEDRRSVARSVRAFVVDELRRRDSLKRKGHTQPIEDLSLPTDDVFEDMVLEAETRGIVHREIERLERGVVDERAAGLLTNVAQTGAVLRRIILGDTNAHIAKALGISAGTVSNRLREGAAYLTKVVHGGQRRRRE